MGEILLVLGELTQARQHLERAIALYDNPQRRLVSPVNDPGVGCLSIAALNLWLLGYPDQALKKIREAAAVPLLGWALAKQGQTEEGIAQIHEGFATTHATGTGLWQPGCLALLAEAYGDARQPDQGLTALAEGLDLANRTG